jgi:hypothetical protein
MRFFALRNIAFFPSSSPVEEGKSELFSNSLRQKVSTTFDGALCAVEIFKERGGGDADGGSEARWAC